MVLGQKVQNYQGNNTELRINVHIYVNLIYDRAGTEYQQGNMDWNAQSQSNWTSTWDLR